MAATISKQDIMIKEFIENLISQMMGDVNTQLFDHNATPEQRTKIHSDLKKVIDELIFA